jgi:hypothetical protein
LNLLYDCSVDQHIKKDWGFICVTHLS